VPPLAKPLCASLESSGEILNAAAGFRAGPQHRVDAKSGREKFIPKDPQRAKPRAQRPKMVIMIPLGRDRIAAEDSAASRFSHAGFGGDIRLGEVL